MVLFFALFGPRISAWLKRKAMERAENYLRNAMGMPPREKTGRKGAGKNESRNFGGNPYERDYQRTSRKSDKSRSSGPIIPKEYAEDVEFIETID